MVVDPPLRQNPRRDPMESSSKSRDLTPPFPIGLLYLVDRPSFIKRSQPLFGVNQTPSNSFARR